MSHDILTGLLPTGNPLAPFNAATARRATQSATDAVAEAPATPVDGSSSIPGDFPAPIAQPPVARRPRRSVAGPLVAVFAVLLFAAVGACLYLLVSGIGISPKGDLVAVEPSPRKPAATQSAPPIVENEPERLPPLILESEAPQSEPPQSETGQSETGQSETGQSPPAPREPALNEAEESEAADQAEPQWELVYQTMRSGRFAEMPAVTAAAVQQASTPEQRERATRLHRLAELAAQYDEAVRNGAASLGAAEAFELVPNLRVIVVESSRDAITLRYEGRVKTYSLDSVPLVLAHSLARFSLPEGDPVAAAARGAYQALWPQATDAHRRQSFQWWRDLEGNGEGGDAAELEPVVRELFEMSIE